MINRTNIKIQFANKLRLKWFGFQFYYYVAMCSYMIEKQIYPFPEGIAITFKSKGASLQGSWNLIALEKVEMQDGAITYGYDNDIKRKNSINPSSTELTEGISSISFAYLSPGFYALVNEDSNASYIIKIVK